MVFVMVLAIATIALATGLACFNYHSIKEFPEGTNEMCEIAEIIQDGSKTFIRTEYKTIIPVVAIIGITLSLFIEKYAGITFLIGACMSSAACILGMSSATYANVRTTNKARLSKSTAKTVRVALIGGSVSGLSVQAFGLLGFILITFFSGCKFTLENTGTGIIPFLKCNPTIIKFSTYSLGCSVVAMFNRVAGGNLTKAADISADIIAKIRHRLADLKRRLTEDDRRIASVIADWIGDILNDIAGNCSDLLESFVATIVASILIAVAIQNGNEQMFSATCYYPIVVATLGLLGSVLGIFYTSIHRNASDDPSREINNITYIAAFFVLAGSGVAARYIFERIELYESFKLGIYSPWVSTILGVVSGVSIGKITEYYTSTKCKPVQSIANISVEGEAFVVTKGDAVGSRSVLLPILIIGISLLISGKVCGIYGIAMSALGMLSFVAATVTIDAFGPIADNAGGFAEMCQLDPEVRDITDRLDAVGNTTAAIGKGFAIGSAAFATVSLIFAYVHSYSNIAEPILNIASFIVIAGAIMGGALVEYFSALLTDNTIESAHLMADESERQLGIPGVLEGTVRPDYERCIRLATEQALKKMLFPSILAIVLPIIGGFIFGTEFVGGILIGATIVAVPRAIFMGNSGGAFDNAKKYVEAGLLEGHGKGSDAHKATVVGDTVGDTRKDVVGVALDIFIKTMSTVANTLAPIFSSFHLF